MGKINDSLLSGTSGRTGRIVVANVFGNEISKIRPRKRTKKPSLKQYMVQQRMKKCADFMASYRSFACNHYGKRVGMSSCYNLAMTNLLENFVINHANQSFNINYSAISFARGNLLGIIGVTFSLTSPDSIEINWQNNAGAITERENDWLQVLIGIEDQQNTIFLENVATRNNETYTAFIPPMASGNTVHLWFSFRSEDNKDVSNTFYAGSLIT
ncbi:MAG TPA: hypothetical protein DEQ26_03635 [Flavobacteriaceae bacterium]|uniref:DUF6266 family protein n=1 Tax=Empedobacter sp. GD03644 TaxID=2975358 RepID=UPI000EBFCC39|nr:DUF6266 family protein [Empedobacter sp. GD03644]MDH2206335.1 DUF6266 family protein [Empedobacter sp. GD03644]HCC93411.1 hypothetical protein [Flavobacteriaceae bacterium]